MQVGAFDHDHVHARYEEEVENLARKCGIRQYNGDPFADKNGDVVRFLDGLKTINAVYQGYGISGHDLENGVDRLNLTEIVKNQDQLYTVISTVGPDIGDPDGLRAAMKMNAGHSIIPSVDDVIISGANGYDMQEQQLNNDMNSFASFGLSTNLYDWNSIGDAAAGSITNNYKSTVYFKPDNTENGYSEFGAYPLCPGETTYIEVDAVNVDGTVSKVNNGYSSIVIDENGRVNVSYPVYNQAKNLFTNNPTGVQTLTNGWLINYSSPKNTPNGTQWQYGSNGAGAPGSPAYYDTTPDTQWYNIFYPGSNLPLWYPSTPQPTKP